MLNHRGIIPCLAGRSYVWGCRCVGRLVHPGLASLFMGSPGTVMPAWLQVLKEPPRVTASSSPHPVCLPCCWALQCSSLAAMPNISDNSLWALLECLPTPTCLQNLHICPSNTLNSLPSDLVFYYGLHLECKWYIQQSRKLLCNPVSSGQTTWLK